MENDELQMVTVLSTCEPLLLALAKSALDENGIPYYVSGENPQYVYTPIIMGFAYNPIIGPPQIKVSQKDADKAKEILNEILKPQSEEIPLKPVDQNIEKSHEVNGKTNEGYDTE